MLRIRLQPARVLGAGSLAAAVSRQGRQLAAGASARRGYADDRKPTPVATTLPSASTTSTTPIPPLASTVRKGPVLETKPAASGTTTTAATRPSAVVSASRPSPSSTQPPAPAPISPKSPPLSSPQPPQPPTLPSPSPPPPPPKRGMFRRLRRLLVATTIMTALGFGGGLVYSRFNDNFHDFFTEYIPFGEQAVLYLDELDFRKRYPNTPSHRSPQAHDSTAQAQVHVPANSGASWRVADTSEGKRQSSAVAKAKAQAQENKKKQDAAAAQKAAAEEEQKKKKQEEPKPEPKPADSAVQVKRKAKEEEQKAQPGRIEHVQLLELPDAHEPVVQDFVRMLNDIITVVNADNAHRKFSGTITKAKDELNQIGGKIRAVRADAEKQAAAKLAVTVTEFEKGVHALMSRLDRAYEAREQQWHTELAAELDAIRDSYEDRARVLLDRQRAAHEERTQAQLAAQATALRQEFLGQIKNAVERERGGRLARLEELDTTVRGLEGLTAGWDRLVDANSKTQQLHVALEAVRASIRDGENSSGGGASPRPFIRELVALREVAEGDPVVDAAIGSIPPVAYQRGLPAAAVLSDRFRRVAAEVRKAALLPDEAGVASHASSWALSKLMFRKDGTAGAGASANRPADSDVEGILARTQMLLEEGDLDGAAREMNGLTGWARTLSRDWLGEVRKVLEVRQALEVISTEARLQSLRMETSK